MEQWVHLDGILTSISPPTLSSMLPPRISTKKYLGMKTWTPAKHVRRTSFISWATYEFMMKYFGDNGDKCPTHLPHTIRISIWPHSKPGLPFGGQLIEWQKSFVLRSEQNGITVYLCHHSIATIPMHTFQMECLIVHNFFISPHKLFSAFDKCILVFLTIQRKHCFFA